METLKIGRGLKKGVAFALVFVNVLVGSKSLVSSSKAEGNSNIGSYDTLEDRFITQEFIKFVNMNRVDGIDSITSKEMYAVLNSMSAIKKKNEKNAGKKVYGEVPITKNDFIDYSIYFADSIDATRMDRVNQLLANLYENYRVNGRGNKDYNILTDENYLALFDVVTEDKNNFEIGGRTCIGYVVLGNVIEFWRLYLQNDLFDYTAKYYDGDKIITECVFEQIKELEVKDPSCPTYEESVLGTYKMLTNLYEVCMNEIATYLNNGCNCQEEVPVIHQ